MSTAEFITRTLKVQQKLTGVFFYRQTVIAYRMNKQSGKKQACAVEAEDIREQVEKQEKVQQERLTLEHSQRVADMDKYMKKRVNKTTGEVSVSVYRAGIPSAPRKRGVEAQSYLDADKFVPSGRQDRTSGVFASPTMNGVSHWVRGVSSVVADCAVRDIRVNPDEVYVYSVRAWERCSSWDSSPESAQKYWDSGITLTAWYERMRNEPELKPEEWELLLDESKIVDVKKVPGITVAKSANLNPDDGPDSYVQRLLKGL